MLLLKRLAYLLAGSVVSLYGAGLVANFRGMADKESDRVPREAIERSNSYYAKTRPIALRLLGGCVLLWGLGILGIGVLWSNLQTTWGGIWYGTLAILLLADGLTLVVVTNWLAWKRRRAAKGTKA